MILVYMECLGLLVMKYENMRDENKFWYYIFSMNKMKFKDIDIDKGGLKFLIFCF